VASDGAVSRWTGNAFIRVAENYPKFRELAPGIVIVSLCPRFITEERLYPAVSGFAAQNESNPRLLQSIVDLLATRLLTVTHRVGRCWSTRSTNECGKWRLGFTGDLRRS
jgi:hypothetical protein